MPVRHETALMLAHSVTVPQHIDRKFQKPEMYTGLMVAALAYPVSVEINPTPKGADEISRGSHEEIAPFGR